MAWVHEKRRQDFISIQQLKHVWTNGIKYGFLLILLLLCQRGQIVRAEESGYLILGADITPSEMGEVYEILDVAPEDMDHFQVITVTNEEEHRYMDEYLGTDLVGDRALSCAKVIPQGEGYGISVNTDRIYYCTPGMYQNALVTAGVKDIEVSVAGPFEITGTAALIGVLESYETMTGKDITEEQISAALGELVITSEIAEKMASNEKAEELIAATKRYVAEAKNLDYREISNQVDRILAQLDMNISNGDKDKIISLMVRIGQIGLDSRELQEQAEEVYSRIEQDGIGQDTSYFW